MKVNSHLTRGALLLTILLPAFRLRSAAPDLAQIRVGSIQLTGIATDRLTASMTVSATAGSTATVSELYFNHVTFNDVRVHISPIPGPIHLKAGEAVTGLPEVQAVLTFQELDSLDPLRRAILDGKARVHAEVRARLELTLFQKLVLLSGEAWSTIPVDEEVPIAVPGGSAGRLAALGSLMAAEPIWIASRSARDWRQNRTELADRVRAEMPKTLVSLETRYALKTRGGEIASRRDYRLGMLLSGGRILAPAEVVEPWSFESSVAQAISRGDVSVDEGGMEIIATPLSGGRSYSLQRRELRIVRELRATQKAITKDKRVYAVRFRDEDVNATLLDIPELKNAESGAAFNGGSGGGEWEPAVVVRLPHPESQPSLWITQVRLAGGRYEIQDPVDAAAFGSPIWIRGGPVAVLQDESSGAALPGVLTRLK